MTTFSVGKSCENGKGLDGLELQERGRDGGLLVEQSKHSRDVQAHYNAEDSD